MVVAFNGKKSAGVFFGRNVNYGGPEIDKRIREIPIFVLPSTSAAARKFWDESYWRELADFIKRNY
jgi:double-stranded uracil-DNA glycosylase